MLHQWLASWLAGWLSAPQPPTHDQWHKLEFYYSIRKWIYYHDIITGGTWLPDCLAHDDWLPYKRWYVSPNELIKSVVECSSITNCKRKGRVCFAISLPFPSTLCPTHHAMAPQQKRRSRSSSSSSSRPLPRRIHQFIELRDMDGFEVTTQLNGMTMGWWDPRVYSWMDGWIRLLVIIIIIVLNIGKGSTSGQREGWDDDDNNVD